MRIRIFVIVLVGLGVFVQSFVRAASPRASVSEISSAIESAKAYLYAQQKSDGTWESRAARDTADTSNNTGGGQWGGLTAIACYALLASGESSQDPRLAKAIAFLKKADLVGVYALGMRCQVWSFLPPSAEIRQLFKRDAQELLQMMKTEKNRGFYDYTFSKDSGYSLSRSQYAVLGLWAAAQAGVEIDKRYWQTFEEAWVNAQKQDGGWNYRDGGREDYDETPGMTAVGVASLFITQDFLHGAVGGDCKGSVNNSAIDRGMNWIVTHFDKVASDEKFDRDFPYATLYAIERIGVASGAKHFGTTDWFQHGASWLVKKQKKDGSWYGGASFIGSIPDTCFSILFLSRGRATVAFNKLDYSTSRGLKKESGWNQRPRDLANLTRWIGREMERDVNWQIVSIDSPVDDWHDSRILYISGKDELSLADEEVAKLKQYVEEGGMIVGHADCTGRGLTTSFRKLGTQLFPQYEWRELPADHPIYTEQQYRRDKWKTKPSVLALSNGCRELLLLIPLADAGKAWQLGNSAGREELFQLGANIFQYSVDKSELRVKGDSFVVRAKEGVEAKLTVKIARLKAGPNPDPEPGGWNRLAAILHNRGVKLEVELIDPLVTEIPDEIKIAHLTGTSPIASQPKLIEALGSFVKKGGTFFIDAAGGSEAFTDSVQKFLPEIAGGAKLEAIPLTDPILKDIWGKPEHGFRRYAAKSLGGAPKSPRLSGIKRKDGSWAVILSADDLSCGLVGMPVDGITGLQPQTATALMIGMIDSVTKLPSAQQSDVKAKSKRKRD